MSLTLSIVAAGIVAFLLLRPHLSSSVENELPQNSEELSLWIEKRERQLQVLKELELEYQTKKISEADYVSMKQSVGAELGVILKKLDLLGV